MKIKIEYWDNESVWATVVDNNGKPIHHLNEVLGDIEDYDDAVFAARCEASSAGYDNLEVWTEQTRLQCNRCKHSWPPRGSQPPKTCPACRSPYWNRRRIYPEGHCQKKNK